ncbi:cell division protein FtsK [Saccharopolyspora sp. 6T]|uniref:FtsK/SpoIIIE domain-containing protein n=1 Tax=Saccharopolyspora sp. 6T TaxID=2877238 RepID=UPI001CD67B41|nr:FtsK/SpoIIIE domain-containing protein [Saccharopolyspora sp. 6T]MCA1185902.1 cell division protein FtsK [Saccharopolyspora sp. 6T]
MNEDALRGSVNEVERAVFDAEIVDDEPRRERARRFARWWQRSPRVPASLKSWPLLRQALIDAAAAVARSPWRFLRAVVRGVLFVVRRWRRWVRVHDYREAAEQSEKLADKFLEIRSLALFRWKVTGSVALGVIGAGTVLGVLFGQSALWASLALVAVVAAVAGRRKEGASGRKPVIAGPRSFAWTMDPQVLIDAFRDAKLIGREDTVHLVERAARSGQGWAMTVDLPATRKAADVIKQREALASALAVDEVQLVAERVRGRRGHAGRVFLWVADDDPYSGPPLPYPLLSADSWDAWRPVPFGRDARNRRIDLPLVWTSLLVGAIPRQGKTFAARLAAAGLVLDPHARLYVFDGKGGNDWDAAEAVAHRFVRGDDDQHAEAVRDHLTELVGEVQQRYTRMSTLDDELCPESKITRAISRDADLGMPITGVILDEVQVFLDNPARQDVGEVKTTLGTHIADLLAYLARKGPAVGVVVILATQRPDSTTIPSRLRAVLGSRFALRVMDWRDSNIVLGDQMNTRGYDASTLLPSHKGVGILRPDGEADGSGDALAMTVRTYYLPNPEWRTLCQRGRKLREAAGTLTGHAAGDTSAERIDPSTVATAVGATAPEPTTLPEPLGAVLDHLGDDLDTREFISTAELTDALDLEPTAFGRRMGELGCQPRRGRLTDDTGTARQVRGYYTADLHAVIEHHRSEDVP